MNEHLLKEDIFKILRILSIGENLSQRDLSEHLGISLGKTNYLLRALVCKGFVKIRDFTTHLQKMRKIKYVLTQEGADEKLKLAYYFLKIKGEEYFDLKKELEKMSGNIQPDIVQR